MNKNRLNSNHKLIVQSNMPYHKREDIPVREGGRPMPMPNVQKPRMPQPKKQEPVKSVKTAQQILKEKAVRIAATPLPVHVGASTSHAWDNDSVLENNNEEIDMEAFQGKNPLDEKLYASYSSYTDGQPYEEEVFESEDTSFEEHETLDDLNLFDVGEEEFCIVVGNEVIAKASDKDTIINCIHYLMSNNSDLDLSDIIVFKRLKLNYGINLS